jgi:hypothetical protein
MGAVQYSYLLLQNTKYVHIKSTTVYAPPRNWDSPPTPHPQASVPPPLCFWGEGNTCWREKGLGESQFRRGAYTVVLFICTYFVFWSKRYEYCTAPIRVNGSIPKRGLESSVYIEKGAWLCTRWKKQEDDKCASWVSSCSLPSLAWNSCITIEIDTTRVSADRENWNWAERRR